MLKPSQIFSFPYEEWKKKLGFQEFKKCAIDMIFYHFYYYGKSFMCYNNQSFQ
jgi:hypothetical protein